MKSILFLLLLISAFTFNLRHTKQDYDSYVMAVQWANGYCKANSCGNKADHVYKNTMTIHGLWPSLKSGKYLDDCTSDVDIVDDGSSLFTNMKQYWPSFSTTNTMNIFGNMNIINMAIVWSKNMAGMDMKNILNL